MMMMILPEVVVALPQRQLGGVLPVPKNQLVVGHHQSPRELRSLKPSQWRPRVAGGAEAAMPSRRGRTGTATAATRARGGGGVGAGGRAEASEKL